VPPDALEEIMQLVASKTQVAGSKRYTFAPGGKPTSEGTVHVGVDRSEREYLVHQVGRQSEAITLEAVGTALTQGVVPLDSIVEAFRVTQNLDKLQKAIDKARA
jgi:hypothetical protein